jgi:hypothetical protein
MPNYTVYSEVISKVEITVENFSNTEISEIPQGSSLGPLLFTLISRLVQCLANLELQLNLQFFSICCFF